MNSMDSWHRAHIRKLSLPRADYSTAVIGLNYVAAGMTWNTWYATYGGRSDPFAPITA